MTTAEKVHSLMKYYNCTQGEAAKRLGISKQAASDALKRQRNFKCAKSKQIIFPTLRDYVNNNYTRITDFFNDCGLVVTTNTARKYFNGSTELRKSTIDRILSLTGMTYEEVFANESDDARPGE